MDNELGITKFENINKNLIGRIMSRSLNSFHIFWLAGHFRIPPVQFDLSKTGIKYKEAIIWNNILQEDVNLDVSEAIFKQKSIKMLKFV